jgi:hypothetical protein
VPIFSRRFSLWTRLYDRLLLEPTSDARVTPMVSEVVVPVLSADAILATTKAENASKDLSGSGYVPYFTVPANEEWHLIEFFSDTFTGNSRGRIAFKDSNINITLSGTSAIQKTLPGYILTEGESIGLLSTGNGGDADKTAYLVWTVTDLGI